MRAHADRNRTYRHRIRITSAPISFAFHFAQNRGVGPQHPTTRDARRGKPRRVPTPALQRVPCRDDRAPRRSGVAGAGANSRNAPSTRSRARPRRVRRVETRARRRVPARRARGRSRAPGSARRARRRWVTQTRQVPERVEADERGDDAPSRVRRGSGHARAAGASAAEIKGKQYTSHGAAMFDPSKARYAAFERCLTDVQMKTIRREIIDANPRPTRAKRRAGRERRVAGRTSRTRAGKRPRPRVDSTCTAAPR